jgi:hypothetical protein
VFNRIHYLQLFIHFECIILLLEIK